MGSNPIRLLIDEMHIQKEELSIIQHMPMITAPCEYCNTLGIDEDGEPCEECAGRGVRVYDNG